MNHVEAPIEGQVVMRDGKVLLLFSRRVEGELRRAETDNMSLDPEAALMMAELLTAMAFEADSGLKPVGPALKASLVEKHRHKLLPRTTLMLNDLREKRTVSNRQLATQILDVFCAEVFS